MRRHRCRECGERGTFDELVDHVQAEHGFAEIEMPYHPYYPNETKQLSLGDW